MNRSAKGLLIVITNLNSFSLGNHRRLAKLAKLYARQTFPLYSILHIKYTVILMAVDYSFAQ